MKILVISDLHGEIPDFLLEYLDENEINLLIISGDITNFGTGDLAIEIINKLADYCGNVFAIPGNCDPAVVLTAIDDSKAVNIHSNNVLLDDILISGFGGSNETPFDTPTEFTEEELYDNLDKTLSKNNGDYKYHILVTHAPPVNSGADKISSGDHVGSESVRKIIEKYQPDIALCGHIHEAVSEDKIGDTILFNPGQVKEGHATLIEIDDDISAEIVIL